MPSTSMAESYRALPATALWRCSACRWHLEDAPLRACRAALLIQQRLAEAAPDIEAQHGLRPQMRIGINTGLVIVGQVQSGESTSITALGDAVNLAFRIQALCPPGGVVLSEAAHRLVQ